MNGVASTHKPDPNYPHPFYITPANRIGASNYYNVATPIPAEGTTAPVEVAIPASTPKRRRRDPFWTGVMVALVVVLLAVAFLAPLAPHTIDRPASPSIVPASVCSGLGGAIAATEVDDAGPYPIYSVQCGDGVPVSWAGP